MDEITAFYERYWDEEGDAPPEHDSLIERKWQELAKHIRRGDRVLDYGCGGGLFQEGWLMLDVRFLGWISLRKP